MGLRGVGKTVLLTRIDETAQRETFETLYIEATLTTGQTLTMPDTPENVERFRKQLTRARK